MIDKVLVGWSMDGHLNLAEDAGTGRITGTICYGGTGI